MPKVEVALGGLEKGPLVNLYFLKNFLMRIVTVLVELNEYGTK